MQDKSETVKLSGNTSLASLAGMAVDRSIIGRRRPFFLAVWFGIDCSRYCKTFKFPVTAVAQKIVAKEDLGKYRGRPVTAPNATAIAFWASLGNHYPFILPICRLFAQIGSFIFDQVDIVYRFVDANRDLVTPRTVDIVAA